MQQEKTEGPMTDSICVICNIELARYPLPAPRKCSDCWDVHEICPVCGTFSIHAPKAGEDVIALHQKHCDNWEEYSMWCSEHSLKYVLPLKYPANCLTCFINKRNGLVRGKRDCCSCGQRSIRLNFVMYEKHGSLRICDECSQPIALRRLIS